MLKFPKLGLLKTKFHREIPSNCKILSATISQVPICAYFVNITTEFEKEVVQVPSNDNIVGLDFSMKELFVSSKNQRTSYPRFFRLLESKLVKAQRKLSDRVYTCEYGNKVERDLNASINIKNQGNLLLKY
ncbi:MAG: hypothetical protein GX308_06925 [Epulopiscium sp.]|nr:hypothetical protein [Candidatus Epulonipiscium sp.]